MEAEIKTFMPNIDPILSEYSVGYLNHAANTWTDSDSTGPSPLAEAATSITALLVSASGDPSPENEAKISQLVDKWVNKFNAHNEANGQKAQVSTAARRLDQSLTVGAQRNMSSTLGISTTGVDLESANTRKLESKVDKKKLEKAERKIAAKQNKKTYKVVEYEASKLINQDDDAQTYEEFFMAVNPLQLGNAQGQKSKDIKLEGIDVTIGGLRILTDTTLTLAYGRRYGLVGQNGIGKSTLLRALARRELAIPTHISILHVEQEISGDDTSAIQAVLDADVWRKHLLAQQIVSEMEFSSKHPIILCLSRFWLELLHTCHILVVMRIFFHHSLSLFIYRNHTVSNCLPFAFCTNIFTENREAAFRLGSRTCGYGRHRR